MINRYRFDFSSFENGINGFVNDNYGNFIDNSLFERDNFTLGNIFDFGYKLEFQKGDFNIANTYYSKPYPTASFYNNVGTIKMNYRLTYSFNPVYYYENYYTLSDISSKIDSAEDYLYLGHGSYVYTNDNRYLINSIKININNDLDYLSNDFYVSTTAGSYNLDPNVITGESPFLSPNLDIDNYLLGVNPIVLEDTYRLIYANSTLSENKLGIFKDSYNSNSYANKNSYYFRDFLNEFVSFEVGSSNSLLKLDFNDIPNRYMYIDSENVSIPTTNLFYGSNNNVGLLFNSSYDLFNNIYSNALISSLRDSYIMPFSYYDAKGKGDFFDYFMYYSETGRTGIDYLNTRNIGFTTFNVGSSNITESTILALDYQLDDPSLDLTYTMEPTFSNTIYFNNLDDIDLVINGLYLGTIDNPLVYNESYSDHITNAFNSSMNITIATYSIGGIITAVFLFRMLFAMIRSNR